MNTENPLTIKVAKTSKVGLKQPSACADGILPKLHCSYLVVGRSGSGKSNVVIHMLKSKELLYGAFNYIFYFVGSPDDSFIENIEIPKENIIKNFDENKINEIIEKNKSIIERVGYAKASKTNNVLFVFDDILSQPQFLKSKTILKLCTECRHYLVSCIFNTQSYTKVPRAIRINCRGIIFFPSSQGEMVVFADEQCLPNMKKRDFLKLVEHCTSEQYQFAFLNLDAPPSDRLRKNLDKVIQFN